MNILIKGMEMPTNCWRCIFRNGSFCHARRRFLSEFDSQQELKENISNDCPLVEISPHGRLIDADALLKNISRVIEDDPDIADVYEEDYELVNDWLASAPTIIEAEEGEI